MYFCIKCFCTALGLFDHPLTGMVNTDKVSLNDMNIWFLREVLSLCYSCNQADTIPFPGAAHHEFPTFTQWIVLYGCNKCIPFHCVFIHWREKISILLTKIQNFFNIFLIEKDTKAMVISASHFIVCNRKKVACTVDEKHWNTMFI